MAQAGSSPASQERVIHATAERIAAEFKSDPEVASMIEQIKSTTEELEHTQGVVKKDNDPALVQAPAATGQTQQGVQWFMGVQE